MGEQRAQVTDVSRRHPHLGEHVGAQQLGQGQHIDLVGLDARGGDQFDLGRMCHDRAADQGDEQVVDRPGVGGGLDHDGVAVKQIGLRPLRPA
jgi:hypothetical protein